MKNEIVKNYFDVHKDEIIADLGDFIAIPSVSSDKKEVDRALDYALDLGRKLGFHAEAVCGHQIGIIEIGEGPETVGILAHVDVVPAGDLEDWETDPFKMEIKDGRLYGRGTLDDKGAVVICLHAMKAVMDSGDPLKKKMQMILGTQEEVDWTDMDAYNAADFKHPDYGFSPDGEFPLCNIEKGIIDSEMHFDIADTPEGDGWFLTSVDGGAIANAIPGKCIAVLTRFENGKFAETKALTTSGKSVHSCQPELGDNAIYKMAEHIEDMDVRDSMLKQILLMTKEKFGSIFGKEIGLYSKTEVIDGDFVHRNAFSVTMFKMEGKHVMLHINCRFAWGTESDEIVAKLTELAASYGGSLSAVEALPAVYVNSQRPFIKEFNDAYEEGSGFKAECVLAYGGSYAKAMPNIVSWGPIFPGEEDTCHEANEYMPIKSLLDNGRVFALALGRVALSDKLFK